MRFLPNLLLRTFAHMFLCVGGVGACAVSQPAAAGGPNLWGAVQQAQQGGQRLAVMRFLTWDELMVGAGEAFYPELAPTWAASNVFDYGHRRFSQAAAKGRDRLDWVWDGRTTELRRNGVPYAPSFGIPRVQHLRVNAWLFAPVQAMADTGAEPQLLPAGVRGPRLHFVVPGNPPEDVVLRLHPETLRVAAVEYTARAVHFPGVIRAELLDERRVGPLWVAHHIVETSVGGVHFHDVWLHDVEAETAPASR
jgi:hypothetical protein